MNKVDNFIKEINIIKKENKLDLSIGEDLSIALMNLISLEEHFIFSFIKTSEKKYLGFLEETRELRKRLLKKIVKKNDDSETWCISKHLLSVSMRLIEIGTKELHKGNKKEAEQEFYESFNLYSRFWEINNIGKNSPNPEKEENITDSNKEKNNKTKLSKISQTIRKMLDCCRE